MYVFVAFLLLYSFLHDEYNYSPLSKKQRKKRRRHMCLLSLPFYTSLASILFFSFHYAFEVCVWHDLFSSSFDQVLPFKSSHFFQVLLIFTQLIFQANKLSYRCVHLLCVFPFFPFLGGFTVSFSFLIHCFTLSRIIMTLGGPQQACVVLTVTL